MSKPGSLAILLLMAVYCQGSGLVAKTSFLKGNDSRIEGLFVYTNNSINDPIRLGESGRPLFIEFYGVKLKPDTTLEAKVKIDLEDDPEADLGKLEYDSHQTNLEVEYVKSEKYFNVTLSPPKNSPDEVYSFEVTEGLLNAKTKCVLEIGGEKIGSSDVHTDTNWGYSLRKQMTYRGGKIVTTTIAEGRGGPLYLVKKDGKEIVVKIRDGVYYYDTIREDGFLDKFTGKGVIQKVRPSIHNEHTETIALLLTYYKDGDLLDWLEKNWERKTINTFLGLMYNVLNTIRDMQKKEIIHQDLCPANVLVDGHRAVVGDFGFARYFRKGKDRCGHLDFALPESFAKDKTNLDEKNDFHALYVIILEVLAKKFSGLEFKFWIQEDKTNAEVFPQKLHKHITENKENYREMLGEDLFDAMAYYFELKSEENKIYQKGRKSSDYSNELKQIKEKSTDQIEQIGLAFDKKFKTSDLESKTETINIPTTEPNTTNCCTCS